jgi:hypothetical protein
MRQAVDRRPDRARGPCPTDQVCRELERENSDPNRRKGKPRCEGVESETAKYHPNRQKARLMKELGME